MSEATASVFGQPRRHFPVAVSASALAQAWARKEGAPHGATVVVDREISARSRLGDLWWAPPEATVGCAVVLRLDLAPEQRDVPWLLAGVALAAGAGMAVGRELRTWWPDRVVDADDRPVGMTKAVVQLGAGQVGTAVVSMWADLERLGVGPERRDEVLDDVLADLERRAADAAAGAAPSFDARHALLDRRVKVALLPKGEARGIVRAVDRQAQLELGSATGMTEHVPIDACRSLDVV